MKNSPVYWAISGAPPPAVNSNPFEAGGVVFQDRFPLFLCGWHSNMNSGIVIAWRVGEGLS
jgi:hypothetical protein